MRRENLIISILTASLLTFPIMQVQAEDHEQAAEQAETAEGMKKKLRESLTEAGYSNAAVAGIMANIEYESSYRPELIQGERTWEQYIKGVTGIGLFQWVNVQKQEQLLQTAQDKGMDWTDSDVQIEFLIKDLEETDWWEDYYEDLDSFKEESDYRKAAKAIMLGYVKPTGKTLLLITERMEIAKDLLQEIEPAPDPVPATTETESEPEKRQEIKLEEQPVPSQKEEEEVQTQEQAEVEPAQDPMPEPEPVIEAPVEIEITDTMEKVIGDATPYTAKLRGYGKTEETVRKSNPYAWIAVISGSIFFILTGHKGYEIVDKSGCLLGLQDRVAIHRYRKSRGQRRLPK